ncbi:MAG: ATP-binding protein [Betaproteobacteria bacterium]
MTIEARTAGVEPPPIEGAMRAPAAASPRPVANPARLASLRQLMALRGIAIGGQLTAIATATALGVALPLGSMIVVLALLAALNLWTWRRLESGAAATHPEVGAHLIFDLAAFTLLLSLAGGLSNPFAVLFLLHVTLAALLLPPRLAIAITVAVVACVAAVSGTPDLRLASGEPVGDGALAAGSLAAYALAAAVLAWFVVRVVAAWREDALMLAEAAQRAQNDAAVMRIGALAAGAAHELATPLTTIAVIAGELKRDGSTPDVRRDARLLAEQVDACRQTLASMMALAEHAREPAAGAAPLDAYLDGVIATFSTTRPDIPVDVRWSGPRPAPQIVPDAALKQALLILLNNAGDASPHHVDIEARWDGTAVRVAVGDRGPGFAPQDLRRLGRMFFTTKPHGKGTGLGLVLTTATVERFGGAVEWSNRPDGGAVAAVRLPIGSLLADRKPKWTP